MEKITEKCTGCRACEQNCPVSCIHMINDNEGFLTYSIDQNICIDCGKCVRTCPQNNITKVLNGEPKIIAARLKDANLLFKSASGGAFAGLATYAINHGWVVFGARYDENLVAHHGKAETIEELNSLLSSKYVQSDTLDTFKKVKEYLKVGKKVLYSGTGCQIGGLKSFLGKEYDNLVTIDVLCHGVPSPLLFQKHIEYIKNKLGIDKISEYDFRDKTNGWGLDYRYRYRYRYRDIDIIKSCKHDAYFMYFLRGNTYRECCYECKYAQKYRAGDITIADYWGIQKEHPEFYDKRGVSLVMINSSAGESIWEESKNKFEWIESTFEKAAKQNHNLNEPTHRPEIRNHVYDGINTMPTEEYIKSRLVYHPSLKTRIKSLIPNSVLNLIKDILKR